MDPSQDLLVMIENFRNHALFGSVETTLGSCSWNVLRVGRVELENGCPETNVTPPALLVYGLEQRPAYDATHASTYLLRFLFGTLRELSNILLASDPSPGWLPSAGLQVPFQIAGDDRIIAMNLDRFDS
ncbi:hypothetical protein EDB87DRAFT_1575158 [Lactarius vividus]|nr:hypothetical protein EDB87DRAFT_1575158 [Lactarius vividus]